MYVNAEFDIKKKELYSIGLKKINQKSHSNSNHIPDVPKKLIFGKQHQHQRSLTMMLETTILKICMNDIKTTTKLFSFILDTTVPARKGSLDSNRSN